MRQPSDIGGHRGTLETASGVEHAGQGYWSFVATAIFILFVLYLAGKGRLTTWLQILMPNPVQAPTVQGQGQAPTGGQPATTGTPTLSSVAAGALGGTGIQQDINSIMSGNPGAIFSPGQGLTNMFNAAKKALGF
jgi:hypothetical protein